MQEVCNGLTAGGGVQEGWQVVVFRRVAGGGIQEGGRRWYSGGWQEVVRRRDLSEVLCRRNYWRLCAGGVSGGGVKEGGGYRRWHAEGITGGGVQEG